MKNKLCTKVNIRKERTTKSENTIFQRILDLSSGSYLRVEKQNKVFQGQQFSFFSTQNPHGSYYTLDL